MPSARCRRRLASPALLLAAALGSACAQPPVQLVDAGTSGFSSGLRVRVESLRVAPEDGAVVDATLAVWNSRDRPLVLVPEDITLVERLGDGTPAARGPAPAPPPPLPLRALLAPLQLAAALVLMPLAAPVEAVQAIFFPPSEEEAEAGRGTHWIIAPRSEVAIQVHFHRRDRGARPAALRVRDLAAGETIEIPLRGPGGEPPEAPPPEPEPLTPAGAPPVEWPGSPARRTA